MKWLDNIPWTLVILGSCTLGLAPFMPMPHLAEKIMMLSQGLLVKPIDIFDLCLHGVFPTLLVLKTIRIATAPSTSDSTDSD